MRLLEKLLVSTGELFAAPYLRAFANKSPEKALSNSLKFLDSEAVNEVKTYLRNSQTGSGGFSDRAGKPDLYYTLFGYFIAKAFALDDLIPGIIKFTRQKIETESLSDVHLHCASIILGTTPAGYPHPVGVVPRRGGHATYDAFLSLLTCYYTKDYYRFFVIRKYLNNKIPDSGVPCTLMAAKLVMEKTFKRKTDSLIKKVLSFYDNRGGFRATEAARGADLLTTSVALYALNFAGFELRMIRPDCLEYVDSLYNTGGFAATSFDPDTDVEYTFYGLLALGALAYE
jgi:prenyltransferase beta subunit